MERHPLHDFAPIGLFLAVPLLLIFIQSQLPPAVPALAPEVLEAVALLPRIREVMEMQQGRIVALEEEVSARQERERRILPARSRVFGRI